VVVVLDPGHNGANGTHGAEIGRQVFVGNGSKACNTTGTETNSRYTETAFNFDVAVRARALLEARGASVVMTRNDNAGVGPCVDQRAHIATAAHAAVAISIHADGGPATGRGFHVIDPGLVHGYNDAIIGSSAHLAVVLRDAFLAGTGMPTSNYVGQSGLNQRTDLGGLNLATVPSVFIECGNMRNAADVALLTDPSWRQRAAAAIVTAIAQFVAPG
jgi:N-acetylmuramoyl-L-alanine amidase